MRSRMDRSRSFQEPPGRSVRPTPPEKSVSPEKRMPPWTKPMLPGVWPGVWMTRSDVRPMAISSPSARRRSGGGEFRAPSRRLSSM